MRFNIVLLDIDEADGLNSVEEAAKVNNTNSLNIADRSVYL